MDVGESATLEFTVTEDDTAVALGSGSLEVLATPRMLAWCEAATCAAVDQDLPNERTSVGTRVQLEHVGARFQVAAEQDPDQKVVAHGEVTRVVVDRDRFLARVARD